MNQQQEARRAAAQAFFESLEHLQQSLESADNAPQEPTTSANHPPESPGSEATAISMNAWEEAIADIDQFMQEIAKKEH